MSIRLAQGQYFGEDLQSLASAFYQIHVNKYKPGQEIVKHHHENNYLSLLVQGQYLEKGNTAENLIGAGDLVFRPYDYDHANVFNEKEGICFNIEIKKNWKDFVDFDFNIPAKTTIYKAGSLPAVYRLLHSVLNNADQDTCQEAALDCFLDFAQGSPISSRLPWVSKIVKILENETDVHHSIQSLSERVYIHPIYLARAFKEKTGFTIGEFQVRAKVQKACSLLFKSSYSVAEIAFLSGFCDAAHLINTFQRVFSSSPHQLRLLIRKLI